MKRILVLILIVIFLTGCSVVKDKAGYYPAEPTTGELSQIQLPDGFSISYYADVPNARSMVLSENGILYVGNRKGDSVYAVIDDDKDFVGEEVVVIASGLTMPNGVAILDGDLYVAEVDRVLRFDDIDANLHNVSEPIVVSDTFPSKDWHGWKFIRFGPDGKLYVPVGAPCNVCENEDPFATITRMNPDGSEHEVFARGIRNTVGFDWHPSTKELWFTDNGRDLWGDDTPPDELNHAPNKDMHFGFPYCHGTGLVDDGFNTVGNCDDYVSTKKDLGPHVAALGMRFYTGSMFPDKYRRGIFIAEHGSWNRKEPIGYRVMFVELDGSEAISYESFAEGWLNDGKSWGRPVDVLQMPDGSLLVSDDANDKIYRISYTG